MEKFLNQLSIQFKDSNSVELELKAFFSMRQISSVREYSSRFFIIQSQINWNESALCRHFYRSLKTELKMN